MLDKSQLKTYLEGNLTPEELEQLKQYLQQEKLPALEELMQESWAELPLSITNTTFSSEELYAKIQQQIQEPQRIIRFRPGRILFSVAASLLLFAMAFIIWTQLNHSKQSIQVVYNETNSVKKVNLEDGSVVWLNEKTKLSYQFSNKWRKIELDGEAFFEVQRDVRRPFSVKTGNLNTIVLGTSFNVEAFAEDKRVEVSLTKGKIKVQIDEAQAQRSWELNTGEQLEYLPVAGWVQKNSFNVESETAWKSGLVVLEKTPLPYALRQISRFYHTPLQFDTLRLQSCKVTSTFDKANTIDEVLTVLLFSNNLTYKKQGQGYLIEGSGCD